jgi:hypothetical protein
VPRTRAAILRLERKGDPDNPHKDVDMVFRDVVEKVKKERDSKKEVKKK